MPLCCKVLQSHLSNRHSVIVLTTTTPEHGQRENWNTVVLSNITVELRMYVLMHIRTYIQYTSQFSLLKVVESACCFRQTLEQSVVVGDPQMHYLQCPTNSRGACSNPRKAHLEANETTSSLSASGMPVPVILETSCISCLLGSCKVHTVSLLTLMQTSKSTHPVAVVLPWCCHASTCQTCS